MNTSFFILITFLVLIENIQCYKKTIKNDDLSKIKIKDKWFVDQDGRVILFHGINAVKKEFPWIPDYQHVNLTNQTQLYYLKRWGFNVIRLGFMWAGLFPEKNTINKTYVDQMMNIIKDLESNGMYVIIDLHQDMMSSKFNAYDGVPLWIVNEMPSPKHQFPWPFKTENVGFGAYVTEACSFAFQCLYDNVNQFQDYFYQYWTTVAQIFSNSSSILAYELINEPWAGDFYELPLRILPGVADFTNLMPLYDKTYAEIRKYDKETIVFYEPVTWGVMSTNPFYGTGFDSAPGNDTIGTALSWHFYCWLLDVDTKPVVNGTLPIFVKQFCDQWQLNDYFNTVEADIKRIGGGASFLTEFGTCIFTDPDSQKAVTDECKTVLDGSDSHFQSWTYWDSDFYRDNFEIDNDIVSIFSRAYPMATNGIPQQLYYNSTTLYFNYTFSMNVTSLKQANLLTEIFVPQDLYLKGFDVLVSSHLTWSFDKDSSRILVSLNNNILNKFLQSNYYVFADLSNVIIQSK